MKPIIYLLSLILSISYMGSAFADFYDGWEAYTKGNYKTALKEWLPISEQGDAEAQFNLAGMYAKGYGVMIDDKEAIYWYKKSAEQGYAKAQYNLGVMYLIGNGVNKSLSDAKHWLSLAYDNGIEDVEILWNKYELWNY